MFYLQSWQEQAEQLLAEGQWLDALALVLDRYKNLEGTLSSTQVVKEEQYLKEYIRRYADLAIMRSGGGGGGGGEGTDGMMVGGGKGSSHHFLVASICIEYCLLGGGALLSDVLFGDIYAGKSGQHRTTLHNTTQHSTT
jgi:hypothetical protein